MREIWRWKGVIIKEGRKMTLVILLFTLQFSLCQRGKPSLQLRWQEKWPMSTVNDQLTFWMGMTSGRDFGGIFGAFHWSRDVADSEVHIQGPKWGFTLKKNIKVVFGGKNGKHSTILDFRWWVVRSKRHFRILKHFIIQTYSKSDLMKLF